MSHDMDHDIFGDTEYGKLALKRLADPHPDFRLYSAGWLGEVNDRQVMRVTGAVFRRALRGPNAGKLSMLVKGTSRTAYLTSAEIDSLAGELKRTATASSTTNNLAGQRTALRKALTECATLKD
jgi:hypothetical protein